MGISDNDQVDAGIMTAACRAVHPVGPASLVTVFDTKRLAWIDAVATERGAHTIALDLDSHCVYAIEPLTHRAAIFGPGH